MFPSYLKFIEYFSATSSVLSLAWWWICVALTFGQLALGHGKNSVPSNQAIPHWHWHGQEQGHRNRFFQRQMIIIISISIKINFNIVPFNGSRRRVPETRCREWSPSLQDSGAAAGSAKCSFNVARSQKMTPGLLTCGLAGTHHTFSSRDSLVLRLVFFFLESFAETHSHTRQW